MILKREVLLHLAREKTCSLRENLRGKSCQIESLPLLPFQTNISHPNMRPQFVFTLSVVPQSFS